MNILALSPSSLDSSILGWVAAQSLSLSGRCLRFHKLLGLVCWAHNFCIPSTYLEGCFSNSWPLHTFQKLLRVLMGDVWRTYTQPSGPALSRMVASSHVGPFTFKLIKMEHSGSQSHWTHFKCLRAAYAQWQPYQTSHTQNFPTTGFSIGRC